VTGMYSNQLNYQTSLGWVPFRDGKDMLSFPLLQCFYEEKLKKFLSLD